MALRFHNTLTKQVEDFQSQIDGQVKLYTCGPTVYNYLTVGNWVAYIAWDTLVRTLIANNYTVERVMNITDVGHLVSDADDGEDKLEKGARREGKTAWEVAEFYSEDFLKGMERLNLILPEHITKATDYIPQQLDLIRTLKAKSFTYEIEDGIYYDTSKFPTYADFAGLDLGAQRAGARVEINNEKRNQSDFALWKFSPKDEKRDMEWETPTDITERVGQMGFPGWHLECSAMSMDILGNTLDIHTGGIDHIPVHHTNEIAQSEAASGVQFSKFWLHNNHLKVDGTKISKSLGNGYTLDDLADRGYSALDYRMFVLQSQYSNEGNFTFDNLTAAKNRLAHWREIAVLRHQTHDTLHDQDEEFDDPSPAAIGAIREALSNDLNTPEALRIVDQTITHIESRNLTKLNQHTLGELLTAIDDMLGLDIVNSTPDVSDQQKQQILERQRAREEKDWAKSDELRDELLKDGITVKDTSHGSIWTYAN